MIAVHIAGSSTYAHTDGRHDRDRYAWRRRLAQSGGLEPPPLDRRHHAHVDVLAHASPQAYLLHLATLIDEDLDDCCSVDIAHIKPAEVGRDVNDFLRRIGVAADTTRGWGIDVARGKRARGERTLV